MVPATKLSSALCYVGSVCVSSSPSSSKTVVSEDEALARDALTHSLSLSLALPSASTLG